MKAKILILLVLAVIFNSCNKDKYQDKPQLTLKSVNTSVVNVGSVLTFDIEVTDKQGDIQDTIWWAKISSSCPANNLTSPVVVPSAVPATKNFKATFDMSFVNHGTNLPNIEPSAVGCRTKNDTCTFKFWMKDLANNKSDTLTSPIIVIIHS
jgi:hypothetical protein